MCALRPLFAKICFFTTLATSNDIFETSVEREASKASLPASINNKYVYLLYCKF